VGNFWERHSVNFVVFRSLRLPLNIFTFDLYQSLRGTRMIQIGCEKYLKIKESTAKSGQKLPMNPFSMLYNSLTGHC
jgi:hypothetical protein